MWAVRPPARCAAVDGGDGPEIGLRQEDLEVRVGELRRPFAKNVCHKMEHCPCKLTVIRGESSNLDTVGLSHAIIVEPCNGASGTIYQRALSRRYHQRFPIRTRPFDDLRETPP